MRNQLAALLSLVLQASAQEPPRLIVGESLEGEITDADPAVHTPTLDVRHTTAPTIGKTFLLAVDEPGTYTLELRSYFFDAYLVLRDESGALLAEDDDGLVGTHARIVVELEPGQCCVVPRGVEHHPVAAEECWLVLIETVSTLHTGDRVTAQTRSIAEQLAP